MILHVPYTFAPDPVGGTEIYVAALCRGLVREGWSVHVAAPGDPALSGTVDGLQVTRLPVLDRPQSAEGVSDPVTLEAFELLLDRLAPRIVHLHARTAAVSHRLLEAARARDIRTVFTYHTPTASCPRGTMLLYGAEPCDGVLDDTRCTRCVLESHGVPRRPAALIARAPVALGRLATCAGLRHGPARGVRMRQIVHDGRRRFARLIAASDRVVAVCDWVADVLRHNGTPEDKLVLSRQGLAEGASPYHRSPAEPFLGPQAGALRVGFFGRLDQTKGLEVLVEAIRGSAANIALTVHGVAQAGSERYAAALMALAGEDSRISFRPPVPSHAVVSTMSGIDVVAVPSLWMETGPLVVLEAFAAGCPVLGSNLGGIAELVRDGFNGRLLPPGDALAWRAALETLAGDPTILARWRSGIVPPRTIRDVVRDMVGLYDDLQRDPGKAK